LTKLAVLAELGLTIDASQDETYAFMDKITTKQITDARQVVRWLAERLMAPDEG
jgi:hypothetical protein